MNKKTTTYNQKDKKKMREGQSQTKLREKSKTKENKPNKKGQQKQNTQTIDAHFTRDQNDKEI